MDGQGDEYNHVYIITHTDLDGIGAAAAAIRMLSRGEGEYTLVFAEPYNVHEALESIVDSVSEGDLIIVSDLGVNKASFDKSVILLSEALSKGARAKWLDHHIWSAEEKERLSSIGVEVHVDTSTCATGVVARYLKPSNQDEFVGRLVDAVCSADLWRWDHPMSGKLFRVVGERWQSTEWKQRIVEKFASGVMWDAEMEERLQEYVTQELEGYNLTLRSVATAESNGIRVVATYKYFKGPPNSSMIGALLLSRFDASIAAIVRSDGGLSLRSRKYNVQVIARELGGGGHPRASGAKIGIPFLVKLASSIYPRVLSMYVARIVLRIAVSKKEEITNLPSSARST